jgi:predicted small lipoprotein YifL
MKLGGRRLVRRSIFLTAACMLALALTACTGKGGGYLPANEPAGFTFSCEDKGGLNPPTGKLAIELAYSDLGTSALLGAPFSIHGIVDKIDPVLESMQCIGQNPPPVAGTLTFLGRYRLTSSAPPDFPSTCPKRETKSTPLCRFEVTVQDKDQSLTPSPGDYFSIMLSTGTCASPTDPSCSTLPVEKVFYTRAGTLAGGNITVK